MSAPDPGGATPAAPDPAAGREAALARGAAALGVAFPLVQAGMGGIAGPALAAAVADAGALGTVALYKAAPDEAAALVRDTAARTAGTFGVNVIPEVADQLLAGQIRAVLDAADRPLVLNSYGLPPAGLARLVTDAGHRLLVQTGTPEDAARADGLGAAALALQGTEAGGHHLGTLPLRTLLARTAAALPGRVLLAAGGLHDAADLAALLDAGASGCLCGTAFVAAAESAAHPAYKQALVTTGEDGTTITDRFTIGWPGRAHRVLRGPVTEAPEPPPARFIAWTTVADGRRRPVPLGSAAAPTTEAEGRVDDMARYAGLGTARITAVTPAAAVVARYRGRTATTAPAAPAASGRT
ncbi:nitronate monooxygenase [Streptomyces termitum]|uniref:nitronate monooxygenase n=1 Tax=Streptomyces termitum TaxID=67368 RepID=UPI0037A096E2